MNKSYEFPDDPDTFARVMEHFHQISVSDWEERLARYADAAQFQRQKTEKSSVERIAPDKRKKRATSPAGILQQKHSASLQ